ncbi:hypothetical protein [Halobacteriaceae bacterium SHR40]|uniref:hypothetical protein n=1 Tax=Halovenus amylolytica TaxID=2500550 RepID=UPI000FE400E4
MSETGIADSVERADRLSKVIALLFALGVYYLIFLATDEVRFSMIIAAVSAIGVRFYIPYHASVQLTDTDEGGIHDHPATGDYNHGAVAVACFLGPALAVALLLVSSDTAVALYGGIGFSVVTYLIFRRILDPA